MASQNPNGTKRDEKGRNIQVVVRCRPFNIVERKSSYGVIDCDTNRRELMVKTGGVNDKASRKTYTFDMVFGPAAKQIEVYRSVVCPILDEVIMGYNCTVFAYGQTGTGKTFTMEGERSPNEQFTWEEDPLAGIIPRTLHQIFEKLSENGTEFSVKVSLLEIYNEELFDLLSPSDDVSERLQLFDDPRNKRGVVVKGLEEVTVHNKDEVYQILERGAAKRRTASTLMNAYSSRSHSVFSVTIHMKEITLEGEELVKIGKLNLVDLAGSENIGRSGAVDKRAREAGNINQSLLTLGRVITALVEKRPHIPYRESKLTRILQDSLGGRTKTSIIATVSPSSSNLEETLSTLEYASRAKNIMNKPEVNQKLTKRTLIKEYTEEIERLKRDLAATRDKNGVYLSAENYETMVGRITSHEEHVAELTDRIALMEEELRRVTELFTDSKSRLDQCSLDLSEKQQRLEETSQSLQQTKEKLSQEEFISSELASAQDRLYATAGQLLRAADTSTNDTLGLHDKLDRKLKVEQVNRRVQQGFGQRMDGAFSSMQRCIQQQQLQQRSMLSSCTKAMDGLALRNEAALKGAVAAVQSLVGGVGRLVAQQAGRWRERLEQQQVQGQQDQDRLVQMLEQHQQDMEAVLAQGTLMGLSAVQELHASLGATAQSQRVLATRVEALKETGVFLGGLAQKLADLREAAALGFESLQAEQHRLEEEIRTAQERHQAGMSRTIRCLQDQLDLLAMEAQSDFSNLHSASKGVQKPVQVLQETISRGCMLAEDQVSAQAALLTSTTSSLASSLHVAADESLQNLEKLADHCSHLHTSVSGLVERGVQWSSRSREEVSAQVQGRLSFMESQLSDFQTFQQEVEALCRDQEGAAGRQLSEEQLEVRQAVEALQEKVCEDQKVLEQQRAELQNQVELNQQLVHSFLQEELQQDVPTGSTPQRRDLVYPRELLKLQSRSELLEDLRRQQEALHTALQDQDQDQEGDQDQDRPSHVDLDSLEDEPSACESETTEPSFIDENLVFNESRRLPFFKQKRAGKESRIPPRSKVVEAEATGSPQKSRLPLRCQN